MQAGETDMKKLKNIFAFLLALMMALSLAEPAAAASDVVGTTIRLAESDGTVSVKDKSGRDKTIRDDMRLYNGYSIETGGKSYAYISLDDEKAIKLDEELFDIYGLTEAERNQIGFVEIS